MNKQAHCSEQDCDGEKRGGNRARDKRRGNAHGRRVPSVVAASACPCTGFFQVAGLLSAWSIPVRGRLFPMAPAFRLAFLCAFFRCFLAFIAGRSRARGRSARWPDLVSSFDLRAVLKVGKAARNDCIASRDALADHRLFLTFLHNFHIGELRRIFRRDEINITSVRALLDGDRGHDDCVLQAF